MLKSRSILEIDLYIAISAVVLLVISVLFVFSSGVAATGQIVSREYIRQIIWAVTGLVIMITLAFVDYRFLYRFALPIYVATMVLLGITLLVGHSVSGAQRWLAIGGLGAQPSEFAKLALIVLLARVFSNKTKEITLLKTFLVGLAIAVAPTILVLAQPDLGTAMVYIPVFVVVAYFSGARPAHIGFLVAAGVSVMFFTVIPFWAEHLSPRAIPATRVLTDPESMSFLLLGLGGAALIAGIGSFFTRRRAFLWIIYGLTIPVLALPASYLVRLILRDYQIMRLVVFVNPDIDPQGAGWNIIQSMTAVGSGGLFGKGFLQGTQSHYQYLPAQSTDFIFSILAEEWGFIGVLTVFLLVSVILARALYIMVVARDRFASLMVSGIAAMFIFHFLVNVGMTIGIMPITGLPLLLLSFGGSSIWTALAGLGIVMSVYQHRYQY